VLFDRVGKEMVGKPLLSLLRAGLSQSTTLDEVMETARSDQSTPRELAVVVSKKYRLVVSVTSKSFEATSDKPSYQVHRIDEQYGKKGTPKRDKFDKGYETFKLGAMIHDARLEKGLTQEQLAEKCGTNKAYISKVENDIKDVRISTLQKIIEVGLGGQLNLSVTL